MSKDAAIHVSDIKC